MNFPTKYVYFNYKKTIFYISHKKTMDITIKKDGEWYLAEVLGKKSLYAFWYTKQEAIQELKNVIDMMVEFNKKI